MWFWMPLALAVPPSPGAHPVRPVPPPHCPPGEEACTPVLARGLIGARIRRTDWRYEVPTALAPAVFTAFPARTLADLSPYVPLLTAAGGTLYLADIPATDVAFYQDGVRLR